MITTGRLLRRTAPLLCLVLVLGVYLRSGWSYGKRLDPSSNRTDFQNLQADAFLAGQLNLTVEAPSGLRALSDPYDPTANATYRSQGLHDLSYYHGKLFTYFGPAPVVLLFIPFRLLRVGDLSPTLGTLLFCTGGYLASLGTSLILRRRFLQPISVAAQCVIVVALGLASPAAWLISIGRGYEVAIASGYFLVMSGVFFLSSALFGSGRHRVAQLAAGATLLAGASGARPTLIVALLFVVAAIAYVATSGEPQWKPATTALMAPVVVIGAALAWYNQTRFGSVTEFGTSYQLLGENVRVARVNEFAFLSTGLFDYLIALPRSLAYFPWLALRPAVFPMPTELNYMEEPVVGLLSAFPAAALGVGAFFARSRERIDRNRAVAAFVALSAVTGFLVLAITSFHQHVASMRYEMDWTPLFLLASVIGGLAVQQALRPRSAARRVFNAIAVFAVLWSATFAIAITAYPCAGTGSC